MSVGQEQCCTICCSEYVKDEVITELPCHHLFHKPCVTLWLQKVSATVCFLAVYWVGFLCFEYLHSHRNNSFKLLKMWNDVQ